METVKKEIDPLFRQSVTTREELMVLGREINARAGIPPPPPMTREELNAATQSLRAAIQAEGIGPEENAGSRELMRMRYGDDWTEEGEC